MEYLHYKCRAHRDADYKRYKAAGRTVTRRTSRGAVFSPDYLEDQDCVTYRTPNGFGGSAATYMAAMYVLEVA